MSTVSKSIEVTAPLGAVAAYISDLNHITTYIPDVHEVSNIQHASSETLLGSSATFRMSIAGMEQSLPLIIDRYEAGAPTYIRLSNEGEGIYIELRVDPGGEEQSTVQVALSAPVASFLLNMMFGGTLERGLHTLKTIMEG